MRRKLNTATAIIFSILCTFLISGEARAFQEDAPSNPTERALGWIWSNSTETLVRFSMAESKIKMETGDLSYFDFEGLTEFLDTIEGNESSKQVQFGVITDDDFCLSIEAYRYIVNTWAASHGSHTEKYTEIIEESRRTAESLFATNWYEGIIESEKSRASVDAAAKKYVTQYLQPKSFQSEEEFHEYFQKLGKEDFIKTYIPKPLCSEIPLTEPLIPDFAELLFDDMLIPNE